MSNPDNTRGQLEAEAKRGLERLLRSAGKERQEAATELSRIGLWMRGELQTRGTLRESAADRLLDPGKLRSLEECLKDADSGARAQVAMALGEWGDQRSAQALSEALRTDPDEQVRFYYIAALRTIGGPAALVGLQHALTSDCEAIRRAAVSAIEDLATGGRIEDTERPLPASESHTGGEAPTRGSIRTRGALREPEGKALEDIVSLLQRIRSDGAESPLLRSRAEEVLTYLGP